MKGNEKMDDLKKILKEIKSKQKETRKELKLISTFFLPGSKVFLEWRERLRWLLKLLIDREKEVKKMIIFNGWGFSSFVLFCIF